MTYDFLWVDYKVKSLMELIDALLLCILYMQESGYADNNNSNFGSDETSWYWRWKGTDRDIKLMNLGGAEW